MNSNNPIARILPIPGNKSSENDIPSMLRNERTGWPLLQIVRFNPINKKKETIYEPEIRSGSDQYLNIGHYHFALMLKKSGILLGQESEFDENPQKIIDEKQNRFKVVLADNSLMIDSTEINYGQYVDPKILIKNKENTELNNILCNMSDICLGGKIPLFAPKQSYKFNDSYFFKKTAAVVVYHGKNFFTETEINDAINSDVAIFHDNACYADLGLLLKYRGVDPETIKTLKDIFKVDEFLNIEENTPSCHPIDINTIDFPLSSSDADLNLVKIEIESLKRDYEKRKDDIGKEKLNYLSKINEQLDKELKNGKHDDQSTVRLKNCMEKAKKELSKHQHEKAISGLFSSIKTIEKEMENKTYIKKMKEKKAILKFTHAPRSAGFTR